MRQHARSRWFAVLVVGWGLLLGSCHPTVLGPTTPSGYRVVLPEASQALRLHPLALTVRVTDATRHGQATTTFWARTARQLMVQITVEDRTVDIPITVLGETPHF